MKIRANLFKYLINIWPSYRGSGGKVLYISSDFREVKVKVPKRFKTRNYVGTIYGGSMYGAIDPIYMLMLIKILGDDYIVWDKSASIKYIKPGTEHLFADFKVTQEHIAEIKQRLETEPKMEIDFTIELKGKSGILYALIVKRIHIRKKNRKKKDL